MLPNFLNFRSSSNASYIASGRDIVNFFAILILLCELQFLLHFNDIKIKINYLSLCTSVEFYRGKKMAKEVYKFRGCYPMLEPRYFGLVKNIIRLEKIMTNITHLRGKARRKPLDKTYGSYLTTFLDCGVFQKFRNSFTNKELEKERKRIIRLYNLLKPNLASAFDVPSLIWHKKDEKRTRLQWSINNYLYMRDRVDKKIKLVLGVCAFSEKSVKIVGKKIKSLVEDSKILGLGGLVPLVSLSDNHPNLGWIAMQIIYLFKMEFPGSHIHAYGVGGPRWYPLIRLLGADSADYAGFLQHTFKGRVFLPCGKPGYISQIIKYKGKNILRKKGEVFSSKELSSLKECECPICKNAPIEELQISPSNRLIHNLYQVVSKAHFVDEMIENNEISSLKSYIRSEFLSNNIINKSIVKKALKIVR